MKTEAQYQAESDAQTLASAEEIKGSGVRLRRAKTAARALATEQERKAKAIRRIATGRTVSKARRSNSRRR